MGPAPGDLPWSPAGVTGAVAGVLPQAPLCSPRRSHSTSSPMIRERGTRESGRSLPWVACAAASPRAARRGSFLALRPTPLVKHNNTLTTHSTGIVVVGLQPSSSLAAPAPDATNNVLVFKLLKMHRFFRSCSCSAKFEPCKIFLEDFDIFKNWDYSR